MNLGELNLRDQCLRMWKYLYTKGGSKKDYFDKQLEVHNLSACPACEVATDLVTGSNCRRCPVKWIRNQPVGEAVSEDLFCEELHEAFCLEETSPYQIWCLNKTKKNAKKVYNTIKKTWRKKHEF